MTGFSPEWLALREGADHRARNASVRDAALAMFAQSPRARLVDLGCGSGSNLRALAPFLPDAQSWRLVDYDARLLDAASAALSGWAERAQAQPDGSLHLWRDGKTIDVRFEQADLARDLESGLDGPADLGTSAAFFDLVAPAWITRFCAAVVSRRLPLFTVLTYDGVEHWEPPHPADAQVAAAFHAHQGRDKGFGAAAGPRATALLDAAFKAAGWRVVTGASPWRLQPPDDARLIAELAGGAANAVAETGLVSPEDLAAWRASRCVAQRCEIGHIDFFAGPSQP